MSLVMTGSEKQPWTTGPDLSPFIQLPAQLFRAQGDSSVVRAEISTPSESVTCKQNSDGVFRVARKKGTSSSSSFLAWDFLLPHHRDNDRAVACFKMFSRSVKKMSSKSRSILRAFSIHRDLKKGKKNSSSSSSFKWKNLTFPMA